MKPTILHYLQQAIINLKSSKLRSCLAILGILVGTAAVVALISCGQLATEKALLQFRSLGTDLIAVSVFQKPSQSKDSSSSSLSINAWRQLPRIVPSIRLLAPYATAYQPLSFDGHSLKATIVGADESLATLIHIQMAKGHFVSFIESFEHFCVIGNEVAQQLRQISLENPLGHQMQIGHTLYTIVGIAKPWTENVFFNDDINKSIIIPIAGMALVSKDSKINNAIIRLKPKHDLNQTLFQIKRFIRKQTPNQDVFLRSAKQIIASMESQDQIFTLLIVIIGGISMVVGGIGVMNVMLVSVSERKKEIGIRKAIGAKNSDIQYLFLMESLLLSVLGGGLGVVTGIITTWLIAYFNRWPFALHGIPLFIGFLVSALTGIFFGYYPAVRAARMQPIDCLRSD